MRIPSSVPSRAITLAAAMVLVALPPALMTGGQAQTNSDCWNPDDAANSYVETPLWIDEVSYVLVGGDDERSFVDGRVAFVHPGDSVRVEFEVVNRVPEDCEDVFETTQSLEDVVVRTQNDLHLDGEGAPSDEPWWRPDKPYDGCEDKLDEIGGTCSVRDVVHVPEGDLEGEYRLRYLARNEGSDEVLVGAERVVVVGLTPDLTPRTLKSKGDWRTVYHGQEFAEVKLTVENEGDYPYWDPNGGTEFWGRASTDADGDNLPDDRAKLCSYYEDDDPDQGDVPSSCDTWPSEDASGPDGAVDDGDNYHADGRKCNYQNDDWCNEPEPDARNYPVDQDRYDVREALYKSSTVDRPPCIGNDNEDQSDPWGEAGDTSRLVCSYRRGAPLDMPIQYELMDSLAGKLLEVDVLPSDLLQASPDDMAADKHHAIVDGEGKSFDPILFGLNYRAGEYAIRVSVGHDESNWVPVPEFDRGDNNLTATLEVAGADLEIVEVESSTADHQEVPCGDVPEDPCPPDTRIHLQATFENVGDGRGELGGAFERSWKAMPYRNGEQVRHDDRGVSTVLEFENVTEPGEPRTIWDDEIVLGPGPEGGKQVFEVRLDHPENYDSVSVAGQTAGRIAEKTENNDCPTGQQEVDNVWCRTFYFEDQSAPEVQGVEVDAPRSTEQGPAAYEGEDVTFLADVTDSSLEHVDAALTLPDGTVRTAPMNPPEDDGSAWTLTRNFTGVIGTVDFTIEAVDAYGHVTQADETAHVAIQELPKEVEVEALEINGQDRSAGDEPPTYQGTASDPDNWIRVEANVTGTGLDENATDGKNVTLRDPTGELRYDLPVGVYTVCDIWNNVTDERERTGEGDECEGSTGSDVTEVRNKRPRFFVDTRCDGDEDPEAHAGDCRSVSEDLREAWRQVELDWAGSFDVTVRVTDAFSRTRNETREAKLADVDDEPSLEIVELGSGGVPAGNDLEVAAEVTDGLRVERVHLEIRKPDGTNRTFNLTLPADEVDDEETRNGTYELDLPTGRFETLDQAGVYNVTLEARDMAGKTNRSTPMPVKVVDDAAPVILSFTSVPAETQEVDGPVGWEAEILDATALEDPTLVLDRPSTGTTTHTLAYNGTSGVHELDPPIEAAGPDVGNWTYELRVEDWAGNAVQASGGVEVVENLPPQVRSWKPNARDADGRAWGAADATIRADLVDFGHGVERSSIEVTVNGRTVSPEVSAIEHGYRLEYDPGDAIELSHRDVVTVRVSAADRSAPDPLVADEIVHQFTLDARAPDASVRAHPAAVRDGTTVVGPDSTLTVDVEDAGAGPAPGRVRLQRIVAGTVAEQQSTEVEPGTAFRLSDLGSVYAGHGEYRLRAVPVDAAGNEGVASHLNLTADAMGPSVTVFPKADEPPEKVFAEISDASSVASAEILYRVEGEEREPIPMREVDGVWQGEIPSFPKGTTVWFRVQATDLFGNVAGTDEKNFSAGDTPPEISIEEPEEGTVLSGSTTVAWTAADEEVETEDLEISLSYREAGAGKFQPIPGAQEITETGSHAIDTRAIPNGEVTLQAIVFDGSTYGGDRVTVQVRNVDALFGDLRFDDAEVREGKARLAPGEDAVFGVDLQDEARTVWANVTRSGQTVATERLEPGDDGRWTGTIRTPQTPGTYEIDLVAVTPDGPVQTDGAYSFEVASDGGVRSAIGSPWVILSTLFVGSLLAGGFGLGRKW